MLVFDLDPGSGIEWTFVTETALVLRDVLKEEGLKSWPKVTGGKGVHVMAPIEPNFTHDQAHRYCREIAQRIAATDPQRYTVSAALARRPGRLFIDYLRNGRGTRRLLLIPHACAKASPSRHPSPGSKSSKASGQIIFQ